MVIAKADDLKPLLRLFRSPHPDHISGAVGFVCRMTFHPENDSPIIEAGVLQPLVELLTFRDDSGVQWNAATALCNLAEANKLAVFGAGAVQSINEIIMESEPYVQDVMTDCISVLSHDGTQSPFNCLP